RVLALSCPGYHRHLHPFLHDALPISHGARNSRRGNGVVLIEGFDPLARNLATAANVDALRCSGDAAREAVPESRVVMVRNGLARSEEHTSELQSREKLVCRLLLGNKE